MKKAVYQGHGQIESYNLNSALWGVVSHEQRHKNFNKYISNIKNEEVKQDVKITIQFKDGQPVPVEAYTDARFSKKKSTDKEEDFLKILYLNFKKSKLKKEILESKDKKAEKYIELKNIENELKKIQKNILNVDNLDNLFNNKRDFAKFYGIFDFQKYNLPPVMVNNPFISAYKIEHKLKQLQSSDNSMTGSTNEILTSQDSYRNSLIKSWEELYSEFNRFNSFVKNFHINFYNLETSDTNKEYLDAKLNSNNSNTEKYDILINKLAKSLIIYSKKFDDPYTELNLSGTFSVNGVEVDVESSDSLYDIVQKINWGEDSNQNGVLDYDENEDGNNNEKLDGGTKEHGVYAYIEDNRLYLKNIETGNISIVLEDSNGILSDFQLIKKNPLNNSTYFPNILQNGANADVTINNTTIKSQSNNINYKDITLNLKKTSNKKLTVKISEDNSQAFNNIKSFVNAYNNIIEIVNKKLTDDKLQNSSSALSIKRNLKIAVFFDIKDNEDVTDIGLNLKENKQHLTELQISNISDKKGNFNNSLKTMLSSLGLIENNDETIEIDNTKLSNAIKNNKTKINEIFFSENGIVKNLENVLDTILNSSNGIIKNEILELSNNNLVEIKKFFLKEKTLTDYYEEKLSTLNNILKMEG